MRHLLVGASILVGACGGASTAPVAPKNAVAPRPPQVDYTKVLADPLAFLPIDADIVFSVDLAKVRRSGLWKTYGPKLLGTLSGELAEMKRDCNVDLPRDVSMVRLAMMKVSTGKTEGVVVVRGIAADALRTCARKFPDRLKLDGDLFTGIADNDPYVMQFVDPKTLVVQVGPTTTKSTFRAILASGTPLRNSPAFTEMFAKIDQSRASWILVNGNAEAFKSSSLQVKGIYGSVDLETGLTASGRVRFADAAQAAQITQTAQSQIGGIRGMVTRLDLAADQNEMTIELAMTEAQVASLIGMFGGMLGGGGGNTTPLPPFVPRSNP